MYEIDRDSKRLIPLRATSLSKLKLSERFDLEEWMENSPEILGEELLIIAKELILPAGSRLDLLAIDKDAALVIVELKRDVSGREVEWQALKYASYCANYQEEEILSIFARYLDIAESDARDRIEQFIDRSVTALNERQRIMLCAREFHSDVASAVLWLREYGLDITCIRIVPFEDGNGRVFLKSDVIIPLPEASDYIIRKEKKEKAAKESAAWSQYLYVNVGERPGRNWDDNRKYGYMSAGGGRNWSKQIERLSPGDLIFAYLAGAGYVGFGRVLREAVPIQDFVVEATGKKLLDMPLVATDAGLHKDDPEMCEYAVAVEWLRTYPRDEAKTFSGIFAHPAVVARMRRGETVDYLEEEFDVRRQLQERNA